MKRIEIEGQVYCPRSGYEGYQDLADCMICDYHGGIEVNYVVCAFARNGEAREMKNKGILSGYNPTKNDFLSGYDTGFDKDGNSIPAHIFRILDRLDILEKKVNDLKDIAENGEVRE